MATISYYVSDYGYGHAARSIAVIRSLLERYRTREELRISVCSNKALPFIQQSLKPFSKWISFRECSGDLGYVLDEGSIQLNKPKFHQDYKAYISTFPYRVKEERAHLRENKVELVVSDISPVPFLAADLEGIPSVGISNFTWYTAYRQMVDAAYLQPLRDAYAKMDYFVGLAGADEPEWGRSGSIRTGFFCRTPDWAEVARIRMKLNPAGNKRIVFFPIGLSISVDDLQEMGIWDNEDCLFVVSHNMKIGRHNTVSIPREYTESQNYTAAADLVISKPGWGTVGEALCLGKPLVLLDRKYFKEDSDTVNAARKRRPVHLIKWEQLKDIRFNNETAGLSNDKQMPAPKEDREAALRDITDYLIRLIQQAI